MLSKADVQLRLWYMWMWLVDLWEFLVLLTLGFHPARSIISLHCDTKETCDLITTCLNMYRRSVVGSSLSQLKDLLSSCDALSIAQLTTDDGYNLLQLAVQKGDLDFVEYLLRDRQIDPNISKCSLPLHIALHHGSVNMVELLLTYKARPQHQGGMCYPQPHVPVYSSHSKFFFVSPSMVCGGSSKDAYQRAIDSDNVELLQMLLNKKSSSRRTVLLLHYACEIGADRSMRHLVEEWSADINASDNRGLSAIMHSLLSDLEISQYLVAQGADVGCVSYQSQTVLHKLYCNTEETVPDILEKTRLFLALGADSQVNACDVFRNTGLHYLCMKYAANEDLEVEVQLRECLGLLLTHNADTCIADADDRLPLLTILQCSCLNSTDNDSPGHTYHQASKNKPANILHIIKLFSQANIKSIQGVINKQNETAMFFILRMCFDYEDLSYIGAIHLLQYSGANINHVAVTQLPGNAKPTKFTDISAKSLMTVICDRARQELQFVENSSHSSNSSRSLVSEVLEPLFRAGLDPNAQQVECRTPTQSVNVKALACFTHLIQESHSCAQLSLLEQWLRVALQWGANPELQSYRPEPQICTSQGGIFLKQASALPIMNCFLETTSHHWTNHSEAILRIVLLISSCMSQNLLFHTINAPALTSLSQLNSRKELSHILDRLIAQPRTLQTLARQQIYNSLTRMVCKKRINLLPLPTLIKTAITQIF